MQRVSAIPLDKLKALILHVIKHKSHNVVLNKYVILVTVVKLGGIPGISAPPPLI